MRLREYEFSTSKATICYARDGRRLHEGDISKIPEHLLDYFISEEIINDCFDNTYLEIVESEDWLR